MPDPPQSDALGLTVVEADRGWGGLGLAELWSYRELLYFFARRALLPGQGRLVQKSEWRARQ